MERATGLAGDQHEVVVEETTLEPRRLRLTDDLDSLLGSSSPQLFRELTSIEGMCDKVSSLEVDVDDLYAGLLRFASGVTGTLVVEVISRPAVRSARVADLLR